MTCFNQKCLMKFLLDITETERSQGVFLFDFGFWFETHPSYFLLHQQYNMWLEGVPGRAEQLLKNRKQWRLQTISFNSFCVCFFKNENRKNETITIRF